MTRKYLYMHIKKPIILSILFLGSALVAVFYVVRYPQFFFGHKESQEAIIRFPKQGVAVSVELAMTPYQWSRGLMFREALPEGTGMLFVFPDEATRSFWMKYTRMSLDMLFISADKRIVFIQKNAIPCTTVTCPSYGSGEKSMYVLEVNAGFADTHAIEIGDQVLF